MFELVPLPNGTHTLRDRVTGETFHPGIGPAAEAAAIHVGPMHLEQIVRSVQPLVIWDVGLGAAANAVAVLEALALVETSFQCVMISFDRTLAPLEFALTHADELVYPLRWKSLLEALRQHQHAVWDFPGGGRLDWHLRLEDFTASAETQAPDAVMYDPYSPGKNPAMWSLEHFSRMRTVLTRAAILTSYSRSTAVRVTLLLAGFYVGVGGATGSKEETTVAATRLDLLEKPLGSDWLRRVRSSTSARPLGAAGPGPARPEDLQRIERHPQFHPPA